MRAIRLPLVLAAALGVTSSLSGQAPPPEMKEFFVGLIRRGPAWSAVLTPEGTRLSQGHFDSIERLVQSGEMVLAGPFADGGELAGLFVYDVESLGRALELAASDPAVAAGRFEVEVKPWWGPATLADLMPIHRERFPVATDEADDGQETTARSGSTLSRTAGADVSPAAPGPLPVAEAYLARYVAGDLDGLAELLDEDAVFEDPTMLLSGRPAVLTGLRQAFAGMTLTGYDVDTRLVSGAEHVLFDGTVRFEQRPGPLGLEGEPLRFETRLALALRLRGDRIVRHVDLVDSAAYTAQLQEQLVARR